jgi:predicted nucleotidyltransferase
MLTKQIKSYYQNKLPEIIRALKKGYKPEKIILYGSMLDPKARSNDIDLFLIKETDIKRLGERANEASKLIPFDDIPVDCLVYTPEEVKRELDRDNVFIAEILEKGKVLYQE